MVEVTAKVVKSITEIKSSVSLAKLFELVTYAFPFDTTPNLGTVKPDEIVAINSNV